MAVITRTAVMRPRECLTCAKGFLSRSSKKKYCDECGQERERLADLAMKAKKAAESGVRIIGSIYQCNNCGVDYQLASGAMRHCSACREDRLRRWKKERAATDFKFDITARIRRGINSCLGAGEKKSRSWQSLVGYDFSTLKRHLERQFLPGMTWENRKKWHIDHIVPIASFSFISTDCPDFKACWSLTNLRPLWAEDNISKQDKRIYLI